MLARVAELEATTKTKDTHDKAKKQVDSESIRLRDPAFRDSEEPKGKPLQIETASTQGNKVTR